MGSSAAKVKLKSYDEIFGSPDASTDSGRENVQYLPISELHSFHNHPFKVADDAAMESMVESIKEYGVLMPVIARPLDSGGYELISGHRRRRACELAGVDTMPVIVRKMSDDEATILMVDTNIQRESILPSERAFAYMMKLEAIKRQGARSDLTSRQLVGKSETADLIGQDAGESGRQVHRYIRLTELVSDLLDMVDVKRIALNPAVELSHLKPEEQKLLLEVMECEQATPSLSQAQRLKKLSQEGKLTADVMNVIMSEEKKGVGKITLSGEKFTKFFPKSYTPQQMESTILELLEQWKKKRQHEEAI